MSVNNDAIDQHNKRINLIKSLMNKLMMREDKDKKFVVEAVADYQENLVYELAKIRDLRYEIYREDGDKEAALMCPLYQKYQTAYQEWWDESKPKKLGHVDLARLTKEICNYNTQNLAKVDQNPTEKLIVALSAMTECLSLPSERSDEFSNILSKALDKINSL